MSRLAFFFALSLLALAPFASADIPHLISLQGRLTDASNNPLTSTANFVFRIYASQTGGTPAWTETQNSIPLDTLGIFSVLLGSANALSIPFDSSYWLEVQVQSGTGPAQVLSPRTRMGSAGYALRSESPWNTTGNDIYATNAGNVGIGTATPAQKLTVAGDVSWTGTLQGGSVPWARLSAFPSACPAGQYASAVGSSLACSAPAGVPSGAIIMWAGTLASIPSGWRLCDGTSGTPDLRDKFIQGVSAGENPGATGGSPSHTHAVAIWTANYWDGQTYGDAGGECYTSWFTFPFSPAENSIRSKYVSGVPPAWSQQDQYVANGNCGYAATQWLKYRIGVKGTTDSTSTLPPYYKLAFICKL